MPHIALRHPRLLGYGLLPHRCQFDINHLGGRCARQGARRRVVTHPRMRSSLRHPFLRLDRRCRRDGQELPPIATRTMRQRNLLIVGVVALAASVLVGAAGTAIGRANPSTAWPGGMMGGLLGAGSGDIRMDRAVSAAQGVAASYSGSGLAVDEVIEFSNGYYASIREKDTGIGAFEVLIDRATGRVSPEPGPNMVWNTRYGMMTGRWPMGVIGAMPGYAAER